MQITVQFSGNDMPETYNVPKGDAARYVAARLSEALNSQGIVNGLENEHNSLEQIETQSNQE